MVAKSKPAAAKREAALKALERLPKEDLVRHVDVLAAGLGAL